MSDLEFLKELKENVISGKLDIVKHEMAIKMLDDWIDELKNKKDKPLLTSYEEGK